MRFGAMDSLIAVITSLAVGAILLARRSDSAGARPLLVLCFVLAFWHLGDWAFSVNGGSAWRVVSAMGSAAVSPFIVHFVVASVGGGGAGVLAASYGVTAAAVLATAVAFFDDRAYALIRSPVWVVAFVPLLLAPMLIALGWAIRRLQDETDPRRRARLRWCFMGAVVGIAGGLFDLAHMTNHSIPSFGAVGATTALICVAWTLDLGAASLRAVATRSTLLAVTVFTIAAFVTVGLSNLTEGRTTAVVTLAGATALAALAAFRLASIRMQREAMRVQSLALLGTFAAELAHEAKNPLAAIRGAVQLLLRRLEKGADPATFQEHLRLIDDEVGRLDAVVSDYQALSRARAEPAARASVREVLTDVAALHGAVLPPRVNLRTEIDDGLPSVRADPARLRQALLNLVRNAVAAMPGGGTLTLRAMRDGSLRGAPRVLVEVEDTGVGIEAHELTRIFEPLYTNRPGGSGLGLSVTQRIVEEHGGVVRVRSEPGEGSTFTLVLPADEG